MIDRRELLSTFSQLVRFRLATEDDLRPGAELHMVLVRMDGMAELAEQIELNEHPFGELHGKKYVYYRCQNAPGLQCFVPESYIASPKVKADACGPYYTTLYLAPAATSIN